MRVMVMMPYQKNLLSALADAVSFGLGTFILIGDKKKIIETCFSENINYRKFTIHHFPLDADAIEHAKMLIGENQIDYLIFGDIPEIYQLNILGIRDSLSFGSIDIIDLPQLRKFFLVSNINRNFYVDFEEKKEAIMQARPLMKGLDIKRINVVLLTNTNNKNEVLESNIVKMLVKESKLNDIEILGIQELSSFLSSGSNFNIFNTDVNLLIMKNYELSRVFINTLIAFSKARIASFMVSKKRLVLDYSLVKNKENLFFALIILEKLYLKKIKSYYG